MRMRRIIQRIANKLQGLKLNLKSIPRSLLINCLSYMPKAELLKKAQLISKDFRVYANDSYLWKEIKLKPSEGTENLQWAACFGKLLERSSQLKVLDLKFCQSVDDRALKIIG